MDPPMEDDDGSSAASAEALRREFDTIEAQARRKRQSDSDCSLMESDEEDLYKNESAKDSKGIEDANDTSDDSSKSTASTPEVVRVRRPGASDPPAPSPPVQGEGNLDDDDENSSAGSDVPAAASDKTNITPRNLNIRPPNEEPDVSPLTSAATPTTPSVASSTRTKKSPFAMSTSRKANPKKDKEKSVKVRMQINRRVKTTREKLCQIVKQEPQLECLRRFPNNSKNFYGLAIGGNSNDGYLVEFDGFPHGHNKIRVGRPKLQPLAPGEEEPEHDRAAAEREASFEEIQQKNKEKQEKNPFKTSENEFVKLSTEDKANATKCDMKYGTKDDEVIHWDILKDTEHADDPDDPMKKHQETVELKKEYKFSNDAHDLEENMKPSEVLFRDFFPSVVGHAKLIDECHSDAKSHCHDMVKKDKIKFHDPDADDPDWTVKQCHLLMLAAATEADVGVANLWKSGHSGRRRDHANFGQYIPKNYFKAFQAAAAFVFADKKFWHDEKNDRRWDIFLPLLNGFNEKRRQLFKVILLILDESMSGWKPKTSKRGGLPNIQSEPRKPVDLGSMLRNAVECLTGCLAHQDISMAPEVQDQKEFYYEGDPALQARETASLPKKPPMLKHTAEALRQVKGAHLQKGGWVGGDAWFGSVMSSVELMERFEVHSTFVTKKHEKFFPKAALHEVLLARHGKRPAGNWVVMRAAMSGVKLTAIAHAWSQKNIACFITTCGCTEPHKVKCQSKFENEYGEVDCEEMPRPMMLHFLYEFLPLIDEHNKQRQGILQLEKRWLTKNCWFRLLTTMFGMSVVDFHRIHRHNQLKMAGQERSEADDVHVITFSDMMCASLKKWPERKMGAKKSGKEHDELMERIRNKDGAYNRDVTNNQSAKENRKSGNSQTLTCFMCRSYINPLTGKGYSNRTTSFWCKDCKMPLCKGPDRTPTDEGRTMKCVEEHACSDDPHFACNRKTLYGEVVKDEKKRDVAPRRSSRVGGKRKRSPMSRGGTSRGSSSSTSTNSNNSNKRALKVASSKASNTGRTSGNL